MKDKHFNEINVGDKVRCTIDNKEYVVEEFDGYPTIDGLPYSAYSRLGGLGDYKDIRLEDFEIVK